VHYYKYWLHVLARYQEWGAWAAKLLSGIFSLRFPACCIMNRKTTLIDCLLLSSSFGRATARVIHDVIHTFLTPCIIPSQEKRTKNHYAATSNLCDLL